jgi:hypothetical protein
VDRGRVAAGAGEDEVDRGQQRGLVEAGDDAAAVHVRAAAAAPAGTALVAFAGAGVLLEQFLRDVVPVGLEQVEQDPADHHVLPQRDRAGLGDDDLGGAADALEPVAELLGVGHGRGEGDDADLLREFDDDLLPHRPSEAVGEVVDLVHDHIAQSVEGGRARVDHVAQDLGGHDHDRGLAVDDRVAGQQPDVLGAVHGDQIVELLVRQGLDRRGVEAFRALGEREVDGELAHDGLARPRRRAHEHAVAALEDAAGLDLEVVEFERVVPCEGRQLGPLPTRVRGCVAFGRGAVVGVGHVGGNHGPNTSPGPATLASHKSARAR